MDAMSTTGRATQTHPDATPSGRIGAAHVALVAACVAYGILLLWQAFTLPDSVPGHIDGAGNVTRWGSRTEHLVLGGVMGIGMVAIFVLPGLLADKLPTDMLNLPHKDYWTRPENWPTARRMLNEDLAWFGAATLVFVGVLMWQMGAVASGTAGPWWVFWVVTAAYLVGVLAHSWSMVKGSRWRPPTP